MFENHIAQIIRFKNQLDTDFEQYAATAKALSEQFLNEASAKGRSLQIVVSVSRDKRFRSVTIRWSKVLYRYVGDKRTSYVKHLPKGGTRPRYPDNTFSYLPAETRALALRYEYWLSMLRQAIKANRKLAVSTRANIRAFEKIQASVVAGTEQRAS